jgi:hypothetical protein
MGVFDEVKADLGVQKAIATFTKIAIWGAIIIGSMLFMQKIFDFTFDFSFGLGL